MMPDIQQRRITDLNGSGGSRPVPDPTVLTDAAIAKAVSALTSYIDSQLEVRDERLRGMDRATALRLESMESLPRLVDEKVGHLSALTDEKFAGVTRQFAERDTRSERESRDNKLAVDAAFAAQEKQAAAQNKANAEAIGKSEVATAETINKLEQLVKAGMDNLSDKIEDTKDRIILVANTTNGVVNQKLGAKDDRTAIYATIAVLVSITVVTLAVLTFVIARMPQT